MIGHSRLSDIHLYACSVVSGFGGCNTPRLEIGRPVRTSLYSRSEADGVNQDGN